MVTYIAFTSVHLFFVNLNCSSLLTLHAPLNRNGMLVEPCRMLQHFSGAQTFMCVYLYQLSLLDPHLI